MAGAVLVHSQDDVAQWVAASTGSRQGAYFTAADAYNHYAAQGGELGQRIFKQRLQKLLGGSYRAQKMIGGQNVRSVFWDLFVT